MILDQVALPAKHLAAWVASDRRGATVRIQA